MRPPRPHPEPGHHRLADHRADRGGLRGHRHPRPASSPPASCCIASFVLDCTDGQLARYSLQYSTLGAWLDATFDRAKEYAYYAGLALGAARGGDDVWALALGAMVLQTCRHVVDFSFNEANHDATANTSPTAALSDKLDSVGWTVWVRRMIVLPIGERWAMIAVLTAVDHPAHHLLRPARSAAPSRRRTPRPGRVLRSLTRKARRTDRAAQALADLADTGPLAETAGPRSRRGRRPSDRSRSCRRSSAPVLLDRGAWLVRARAGGSSLAPLVYVAAVRRRPSPAPSRAPSTGWSRRSSGPPNTARSSSSRPRPG